MNCEERGCLGKVEARKLTSTFVVLHCTKCTRAYSVPYKELKLTTPQLPESVYTNIRSFTPGFDSEEHGG